MDPKQMARAVVGGRLVFGLAFLAMPGWTGRVWIGRDADRPTVRLLTQAIGVRDLAAGLGALIAMRRGARARGWFEGIALTDALDFGCGLAAGDRLSPGSRATVLFLASASAAQASYAASGVDS